MNWSNSPKSSLNLKNSSSNLPACSLPARNLNSLSANSAQIPKQGLFFSVSWEQTTNTKILLSLKQLSMMCLHNLFHSIPKCPYAFHIWVQNSIRWRILANIYKLCSKLHLETRLTSSTSEKYILLSNFYNLISKTLWLPNKTYQTLSLLD